MRRAFRAELSVRRVFCLAQQIAKSKPLLRVAQTCRQQSTPDGNADLEYRLAGEVGQGVPPSLCLLPFIFPPLQQKPGGPQPSEMLLKAVSLGLRQPLPQHRLGSAASGRLACHCLASLDQETRQAQQLTRSRELNVHGFPKTLGEPALESDSSRLSSRGS